MYRNYQIPTTIKNWVVWLFRDFEPLKNIMKMNNFSIKVSYFNNILRDQYLYYKLKYSFYLPPDLGYIKELIKINRQCFSCSIHGSHLYCYWQKKKKKKKKKKFFLLERQSAYIHFSLKPLFNLCESNCAVYVKGWGQRRWESAGEEEQVSVLPVETFYIYRKLLYYFRKTITLHIVIFISVEFPNIDICRKTLLCNMLNKNLQY